MFRQKHSKPACAMPTYSTFTNMPMTSLLALLTINNGIGVNVYHYQKAETCRTGTNGVASCSWMCSVMNKTKTGTKFQFGGTQDARSRLPRWLIRTQNNAQPTKKSQSAVPHGIVADLVNAYNKYTANHMTFSSTSLSDTAPLRASSRPCNACIATSSLFSRLKKRYSNSTKPLEYDKATTWLLCSSYSSCLPSPRTKLEEAGIDVCTYGS